MLKYTRSILTRHPLIIQKKSVSTFDLRIILIIFNYLLVELQLDGSHSLEVNVSRGIQHRCVLNLILFAEILQRLDWNFQPGHGQKRSQIRRVRGDDYKSEQPPSGSDQSSGEIFRGFSATLRRQRRHTKPETLPQVELPFLVVVLVFLSVVLVAVRRPTIEDPQQDTGEKVSGQNAEPDLVLQHREEFKQRGGGFRFQHHDGETDEIVIRHREIDYSFPLGRDPQRTKSDISSFLHQLLHHPVPAPIRT